MALAGASAFAADAPTRGQLKDIQREIGQGEARRQELEQQQIDVAAEMKRLRDRLIDAAARAQNQESALRDSQERLDTLEARRQVLTRDLEQRRDGLAQSLAALERIARRPPSSLFAKPGAPIDTARSAALLGALVPRLEADAKELRSRIEELDSLRREIILERSSLVAARDQLGKDRAEVDKLLAARAADKDRIAKESAAEAKRVAELGAKARDMASLLKGLETRRAPDPIPQKEEAGPALDPKAVPRLPVAGKLLVRFNGTDEAGSPSKGVTIEARANSQVVTPAAGRVAFAGPFKGYGQLLIVATGGGYHLLLAGLSRLEAVVGQELAAGEPVGTLADEARAAGDGKGPRLYIEVRKDGGPVDPLPWLARQERKAKG